MPRSISFASNLFLVLFATAVHADSSGHENVGQAEIGLAYRAPDGALPGGEVLQPASPADAQFRSASSTTGMVPHTALVRLARWPSLVKYNNPGFPYDGWKLMDGGNVAYYRDAFIALDYIAQATHDGETWKTDATIAPQPNGVWDSAQSTSFTWPTLTYYTQINGIKNCFNSPGWTRPVCGTTALYMIAYIKSQCRPYGIWTMTVTHDGTPADSRQFTMLGRVPDNDGDLKTFNQLDYDLSKDKTQEPVANRYDNRCYQIKVDANGTPIRDSEVKDSSGKILRFDCGVTPPLNHELRHFSIRQLGCFLTSGAMVLNYFGDVVDPPKLNTYLNMLDSNKLGTGYDAGNVQPGAVAKHSNGRVSFIDDNKLVDKMLYQQICKYGPQIMGVKGNTHFVMVVGRDDDDTTWQIHDPNGGEITTLARRYNSNTYNTLRIFHGQDSTYSDPLNRLDLNLKSPAELLVTAPDGSRTGFDPATGVRYSQIPHSEYMTIGIEDAVTGDADPDPQKIMEINRGAPGTYLVQVTGTGSGTYTLEAERFDVTGQWQDKATVTEIPIQPGEVHRYRVVYDPTSAAPIQIALATDTTPPVTVASATPAPNAYGWNNSNVTISLNAADSEAGGTGVKEIHVSLSGAQSGSTVIPGASASVIVSAEGTTVVSYYSVDNAGNAELPKTLTVRLDKTPPAITGMPAPGCTLWSPDHKMVEVATVSASDGLTGLFSLTVTATSNEPDDTDGPDVVVTGSGSSRTIQLRADRLGAGTGRLYTIIGAATDYAGNVATATATCTVPHDQGK